MKRWTGSGEDFCAGSSDKSRTKEKYDCPTEEKGEPLLGRMHGKVQKEGVNGRHLVCNPQNLYLEIWHNDGVPQRIFLNPHLIHPCIRRFRKNR